MTAKEAQEVLNRIMRKFTFLGNKEQSTKTVEEGSEAWKVLK